MKKPLIIILCCVLPLIILGIILLSNNKTPTSTPSLNNPSAPVGQEIPTPNKALAFEIQSKDG